MTIKIPLTAALLCAAFLTIAPLAAQDSESGRRLSLGFRVRTFPLDLLDARTVEGGQSDPPIFWTARTTSRSPRLGLGPVLEYRLTERFSFRSELQFHRLSYDTVTNIFEGIDSPDTFTDDRAWTGITERTRANYWDIPLLLDVQEFSRNGWLSRVRLSGGYILRNVSHVRSGTETVKSDGSTTYHERPAVPASRNSSGAVAAVGLRFADSFGIRITPEIRYIRWFNPTLSSTVLRSDAGQFEFGISITY